MYMYIYTYIYTYMCIYTYTYIYIDINILVGWGSNTHLEVLDTARDLDVPLGPATVRSMLFTSTLAAMSSTN